MPVTVVKVGLDPKRQIEFQQTLDLKTLLVTTTVTEYWIVQFSGKQTNPAACIAATDGSHTVPIVGADWGGLGLAWCNGFNPRLDPQSAVNVYNCRLTYSSLAAPNPDSGKWDVKVKLNGVPVTETVYFDLDQNQITNSAGQNFSNQPTETFYDEEVEVSFKTTDFDEDSCEALQGQINENDVTLTVTPLGYSRTFPATTMRLDRLETEPVVQAGALAYWQVTETFTYRATTTAPANCQKPGPDGDPITGDISTLEYRLIVDQGYQYIAAGDDANNLTNFKDKYGQPMNAPCLLNGSGGDGRPSGPPSPTDATFIAFRAATQGDFSPLFEGIS